MMSALSLSRAPQLLARWGTLTARSGLASSLGHLAAPSMSSLPRSLPQETLARLRSIHCYTFAWKNGEEGVPQPPRDPKKPNSTSSSGNGGSGGGGGVNYGVKSLVYSLALATAAAYVGAYFTRKESVKLEKEKKLYVEESRELSDALENSTIPFVGGSSYISVPAIKQIRSCLTRLHPTHYVPSILVCGPRGVGKSTVMNMALEGVKGIIYVKLNTVTIDQFYASILRCVDFKCDSINKEDLVHKALLEIKKRGGKKPTLFVEVDEKCEAEALKSLLLDLKTLVSESRLANCFVVTSTSRASLLIPVTLNELRAQVIVIQDPSTDVIENYLNTRLSSIVYDEDSRQEMIKFFIKELGARFLDASNAIFQARLADPGMSSELFYASVRNRKREYQSSCLHFAEMLQALGPSKKQMFEGIVNGTLILDELANALKLTEEELINKLSKLHPHPVYIHPESKLVNAGNFIAQNEFKKYI